MKKIGCFPGTFDPIHFGHLKLINFFLEKSDLDEVWIIITPLNPLKSKCLTTENVRFKMSELAISHMKNITISKIEFSLNKPNYSINTLKKLSNLYPEKKFVLLLGEDNLSNFHKWKNYQEILNSYELYVYPRESSFFLIPENLKNNSKIKFFKAPQIKISSSQIRKNISDNIKVSNLIQPKVYNYIRKNKLYFI